MTVAQALKHYRVRLELEGIVRMLLIVRRLGFNVVSGKFQKYGKDTDNRRPDLRR